MKIGLVIVCIIASNAVTMAGDPRDPGIVKTDSTAALRYSVAYIEAGFQRGELEAAVKRFSEAYTESGIQIPKSEVHIMDLSNEATWLRVGWR